MLHEQEPTDYQENTPEGDTPPLPDDNRTPHVRPPDMPAIAPKRPPPEQHPLIKPDMLIRAGVGLGAVMIILAAGWTGLIRGRNLWAALHIGDAWQLLPGVGAGILFAWLVWRLGQNMPAAQQIVRMLASTLDLNALTVRHVLIISVLAAIPEELLFRGAIQPDLGLLGAALIFGVLHALTRAYLIYATVAGLMLGIMFAATGSLWMPIGAHFAVDVVMFVLLLHRRNHHIA